MSYTGRAYRASPGEASAARVNTAARGRQDTMDTKIELIMAYIRGAASEFGSVLGDVPCPTEVEWSQLSCGRHPSLPSPTTLQLYADEAMRTLAGRTGSIQTAYFRVAQRRLRSQRGS